MVGEGFHEGPPFPFVGPVGFWVYFGRVFETVVRNGAPELEKDEVSSGFDLVLYIKY